MKSLILCAFLTLTINAFSQEGWTKKTVYNLEKNAIGEEEYKNGNLTITFTTNSNITMYFLQKSNVSALCIV